MKDAVIIHFLGVEEFASTSLDCGGGKTLKLLSDLRAECFLQICYQVFGAERRNIKGLEPRAPVFKTKPNIGTVR